MAINSMNAVFLEVIEWFDETGEEILHRIPESGSAEIKFGSQLVVRENQQAVFFKDGRAADVFGPGRHTLTSANLPILTKLLSLPWGFTSPFRCEVCMVNMKTFTNMRWGTKEPVAFRDKEFGMVRLRAFGAYTFRVSDPLLLINNLVGTRGIFTTAEVEDFLRDVTVSRLNDLLGATVETLLDLPAAYDATALELKARVTEDFGKLGLEMADFYINSITPPPEVQKTIDERSSMAALGGDMDRYLKYKAAVSMEKAAGAPGGGEAAQGMGIGVGAGLGMMIPGMIASAAGKQGEQVPVGCPHCGKPVPGESRFCAHCGKEIAAGGSCSACGQGLAPASRFCSHCGVKVAAAAVCGTCGQQLPGDGRFCPGCGTSRGE